ncbi:dipeptidase [Deinococcus roseus]|uniref:Membrane dipeptidase n=1 Tax=Deinococcus roseus TaxID=392414 RepID=A0ABQ2DAG7_9DEIO|nr:dipeptidase [Deinococcus roseus]GGJ49374.1 membrane dipeptidase [Deinococcus roseus]
MSDLIPIFDGHNDVVQRLVPYQKEGDDFLQRSEKGHLDLPRAQEGGMIGGFFALMAFHDPPLKEEIVFNATGYEVKLPPPLDLQTAQKQTFAQLNAFYQLERRSEGKVKIVQSFADLQNGLESGQFTMVLHFEGAEMIDPELTALEVFYRAGVRSIGPVWSRPNAFGHGVPFAHPASPDTGEGLTDAGKELVQACNRLGILLDVSHLNEKGFWDLARITDAPIVATHANAHSLCPATRNLTDRQLAAIRESGGLVGVNFSVSELRPDGHLEAKTPLDELVRQVDHLVQHLGLDGVAIGSDFDGAVVPEAIKDASGLQHLVASLRTHGYDDPALHKICHENWFRILEKTWKS